MPASTATNTYTYGDEDWGDLLTAYNGAEITYDAPGILLTLDLDSTVEEQQ